MFSRLAVFTLLGSLFVTPAWADWFGNAVQKAIERTGTRGVNEGADAVYDGAKSAATTKNSTDSNSGGTTPSSSANNVAATPAPAPAPSTAVAAATGNDANGTGSGTAIPNEAAYNKFDFIPGDKVLFLDDFSDTDVGEFPRKWTLTGPYGGGGPSEVVAYMGQNYLSTSVPGKGTVLYLRLNQKGDMPEKFTIEFDAMLVDGKTVSPNSYNVIIGDWVRTIKIAGNEASSEHNKQYLDFVKNKDGGVHHVSISVNGTFVKAYVDHTRVVSDPEAIPRPVKNIGICFEGYNGNAMFSNFRLAEGGKNIKSAIDTDGKIITHGILFDLGSDKIRPESAATLNMILGLLNDKPDLKFSIEGHTDNQGSPSTNQPLSERRAASIKNWLAAKGIDADRLQIKGWGQTKPIDSNSSKEGQANNRRVEFVKL